MSTRTHTKPDFVSLDDRDLLVAAKTDTAAFEELYRRYFEPLLAYFGRALGRSELAYDLTAETFAAALLALQNYRPTAAPGRSWLYAIAHNRLMDSVYQGKAEARAREELEMQAIVLSEDGEAMIERIIARLDGQHALELVQDLPRDQREAINSRFAEDCGYAEIAAEMQCSEQVVRKRVSRGLAVLRVRLDHRAHGR